MFAEAVADVYAHGKQARQMNIELVKEYEKRGKDKAREKSPRLSVTKMNNPMSIIRMLTITLSQD